MFRAARVAALLAIGCGFFASPLRAGEQYRAKDVSEILHVLSTARIAAEQAIESGTEAEGLIGDIKGGVFTNAVLSKTLEDELQDRMKSAMASVKETGKLSEELIVKARNSKGDMQDEHAIDEMRARANKDLEDARKVATEVSVILEKLKELTYSSQLSNVPESTEHYKHHRRAYYRTEQPEAHAQVAAAPESDLEGCLREATCTPVPIFFGTDRTEQPGFKRIEFNAGRGDTLILGKAVVTVPKAHRNKGEVNRPSWWDLLQFKNPWKEDPTVHFTIPDGGITVYGSEAEFVAGAKEHMAEAGDYKDHVFVFIHGFNTSFDNALYRTAQIAYDLGSNDTPFGTAFLYSWPSAGEVIDYPGDFDSARFTVDHLKSFLQMIIKKTGAKHVHLIAHSMGNFPLVTALHEFASKHGEAPKLSEVILAAPDIDAKEFKQLADKMGAIAKGVTLYASSKDGAMQLSRNVHSKEWRAGDVLPTGPVIVKGIESIDISNISTDWLALNHSTYAESKELLNDIWQLMSVDKHPPDARNVNLQIKFEGNDKYWSYAH
jgi:esterase/lipase superfamily enzyme